jgi:hypothetical protein
MAPSNPYKPAGAVVEYLQTVFGGPFEDKESFPTPGTAPFTVVQRNPERCVVAFMNTSDVDVWISTRQRSAVQQGIRLVAGTGFFSVNAVEDGILPSLDWFGISSGAAAFNMYVLESVRIRRFRPDEV